VTAARTFRGHFHTHVWKGERQLLLTIALPYDDGKLLMAELGPDPHRAKSIPIAIAVGPVAETIGSLVAPDQVALAPEPSTAAEPFDLGTAVQRIASLTVELRDAAWGERHTTVSRQLTDAADELSRRFRHAVAGRWPA
jgi:hypothetical protein